MKIKTINIGYNNYIPKSEIVAIRAYDSSKIQKDVKKYIEWGREKGYAYVEDCTMNRQRNSVIITKDGGYYLSNKSATYLNKLLTRDED